MKTVIANAALTIIALLVDVTFVAAQTNNRQGGFSYPPQMPEARAETYKKVGDVELKLYVFEPKDHKPTDKRAAVVFFFGGGWTSGSPTQFKGQCEHLASRGMVAISADYRVKSRQQVTPDNCVSDAKSAIRWVRANAVKLGVDPQRIAAGGGSAGGHLAAATALLPSFDEEAEDNAISSQPNALVLFNPAVMLAPAEGLPEAESQRVRRINEVTAGKAKDLSPYHFIRKGLPPTILFHGTNDDAVPFVTVELFAKSMREVGNRCELVPFPNEPHGFFNPGRSKGDDRNLNYNKTLKLADEFFVSLGYLPKP